MAVALLHLPFCCCAPDGPAPNGPTHDGCRSCSLAFTQTVCCGWCCSYLLTLCSQIDGEQSYHDWLRRPYTEEELQPHREAYFAKKTAISSPERMAELERSLADAQAALPDGRKALAAKVEKLTTQLAAAREMAATIERAAEKELHAALHLAKADHGASIDVPRLGLAITFARQRGVSADLIEQAESVASEFASRELADQPGTFCFLSAEALRSGNFEKMPVYADALLVPGLLSRHTLNLRTACLKKYTSKYLAISHRWEKPLDPDSQGGQMQRLCEFLRSAEGAGFEHVWIDVSCMPQHCTAEGTAAREKTPQEKLDFGRMLGQVNLLYLGCSVLIIMDRSYLSRFWTQFESWLSFQSATSEGLTNRKGDARRNYVVISLGAPASLEQALVEEWSDCTPKQAHGKLSQPDVAVTNQSDKDNQLPKLLSFNDAVKGALLMKVKGDLTA